MVFTVTMANNHQANRCTQPQKNETIFVAGMVRVMNHQGIFIDEHRLCLFKRYSVFLLVRYVLFFVPVKSDMIHIYLHCKDIIMTCQIESPNGVGVGPTPATGI